MCWHGRRGGEGTGGEGEPYCPTMFRWMPVARAMTAGLQTLEGHASGHVAAGQPHVFPWGGEAVAVATSAPTTPNESVDARMFVSVGEVVVSCRAKR